MKQVKYKCKKSYPGGPVVGHILNPQDTWFAGMNYWWNNVWFDPKDYSEYWGLVREPIFTTEDGYDVFEKELLYTIGFTNKVDGADYYKIATMNMKYTNKPNDIDYKWFKSKEKAEAWIEENKPQFSKKDMIDYCNYSRSYVSGLGSAADHYKKYIEKIKK